MKRPRTVAASRAFSADERGCPESGCIGILKHFHLHGGNTPQFCKTLKFLTVNRG